MNVNLAKDFKEKFKKPSGDFPPCPSDNYTFINDWKNTRWVGKTNIDLILSEAIEKNASDIHLTCDKEIYFTILGDVIPQPQFAIPDDQTTEELIKNILKNQGTQQFIIDLEYDSSYTIEIGPYSGRRFRVNFGKSFNEIMATFRTIPEEIPTPDKLGIGDDLKEWFETSSGVILICGATGSGKSTTLASIIREIQLKKKLKIITVEKPVEFIYPSDGKSLIIQRSIPEDCKSFDSGLTSAMRSAPNIILIGEIRNKEEIDNLLRASETGHLALSTIHTSNNVTTLNRIRSMYSGDEQRRILNTLSDNLKGIANQVLLKSIDGTKRFAVREMLQINSKIKDFISEDNIREIRKFQEQNSLTMEHQILKYFLDGACSLEEAKLKSPNSNYFKELLEQSPKKFQIQNSIQTQEDRPNKIIEENISKEKLQKDSFDDILSELSS